MDFFEAMAMSSGNCCTAAGMHSASKEETIEVTPGPAPEGVKVPVNAVAVYDKNGKYLGYVEVW